jgi:GAF domain-containing protein
MKVDIEKHCGKSEMYRRIILSLAQLLDGCRDVTASLANASALLNMYLDDVNWVGFYMIKDGILTLGPFQGKTAVAYIKIGDGVCGTAAATMKTVRVDDVHACDNHIACDTASSSEIVVPMIKSGRLIGVLDIDSPLQARFDEEDELGLERVADALIGMISC